MSHYTVLVVGENPEEQLLPFHEFECTGYEAFIQDIDCTKDARQEFETSNSDKSFKEWVIGWYGKKAVNSLEEVDIEKTHKYGYILLDANGDVEKVIQRTNPNRKWDWHQLGGRWTGFFKLKQKGVGVIGEPGLMTEAVVDAIKADSALKKDIDFEGMREEAKKKALEEYYAMKDALKGEPYLSWDHYMKEYPNNIDAACVAYNGQQSMKNLRDAGIFFFEDDEVNMSAFEFAQRRIKSCGQTFAILKDGKWYERGEMGWFGIVHGEKDKDAWVKEFDAFLDSIPEDTRLSVYDCHI